VTTDCGGAQLCLSFRSPACHCVERWRPITPVVVPAKAGTQYTPRAQWLLDVPHARGMTNERPVLSFRSPACHGVERWRPITRVVVPAKAGTQYTPRAQWLLDAPHARGMTNERPVLSCALSFGRPCPPFAERAAIPLPRGAPSDHRFRRGTWRGLRRPDREGRPSVHWPPRRPPAPRGFGPQGQGG
jgi:hypothetical protein